MRNCAGADAVVGHAQKKGCAAIIVSGMSKVVMNTAIALVLWTVIVTTCAVVVSLCRIALIESAQVLTTCEAVQTTDAQ